LPVLAELMQCLCQLLLVLVCAADIRLGVSGCYGKRSCECNA